MPKPPPHPSNFSPDLLALLVKGAKGQVVVQVESEQRSHRLSFRLNQLRRSLQYYGHSIAPVVAGVQVRLRNWIEPAHDGPRPIGYQRFEVIVEPSDDNFTEAIRAAGVNPDKELAMIDLPVPQPTPSTQQDTANVHPLTPTKSSSSTPSLPSKKQAPKLSSFFGMLEEEKNESGKQND